MTNLNKPIKNVSGMIVTCSKCLNKYTIYEDIHRASVGRCLACSNVEGFKFEADHQYSIGHVKPYLEDEGAYDWEWSDYNQLSSIEETG